jgi:DNA modification methylase
MEIDEINIEELNPAAYNPRKDLKPGDPEYEHLKRSILEFDYIDPVIWNKQTGNVVGGHQRLKVLKELGRTRIQVSVVNLPPAQEKALNIALNKIAGDWDNEKLAALLKELAAEDIDLLSLGFTAEEIDTLMPEDHPGQTDPDDVPDAVEPLTAIGDLFVMGTHRLLCGDATQPNDLARLMAGNKANMLWTDPPYGVSYGDKNQFLNRYDKGNRIQDNIVSDHMPPASMHDFWASAFQAVASHLAPGAAYYISGPQGGDLLLLLLQAIYQSGLLLKHMLIWVKNSMVLGRSDYHYKHEPIVYGWMPGAAHYFNADYTAESVFDDDPNIRKLSRTDLELYCSVLRERTPTTIFRVNKPVKSELHPTQKPVALIARMIRNSTRPNAGDICLDPFLGSGSTLIACEKTGSTCYGMEIEPHYCDIIVKRWEDYTGKKAVRNP